MIPKPMVLLLCATAAVAAELPYAVRPGGRTTAYTLTVEGETLGSASLGWTAEAFVVDVRVRDTTPVALDDIGVGLHQAYLADSVEFWIGRHQFVAAKTAAGARLWDYLYGHAVDGAEVVFDTTADGYRVRVAAPWPALAMTPQPGLSFPFMLQVNDRQRVRKGERWKASGRQLMFPARATWDRVSTYGTVFLATGAVAGAAPEPTPFAALDIRAFAYAKRVEAVVQRLDPFTNAELILVCRAPGGKPLAEIPIMSGAQSRLLVPLPWDESQAGIHRAELYLVRDGRRYGPVAEPYFNGGPTTIAAYRSDRHAPADMRAFWEKEVAAMRKRPMRTQVTVMPSKRADVIVEKARIDNHRGNPMLVWVARRRGSQGRRPAHLNVYPPMRAHGPAWPRQGFLGITFCGSLQGDCRLPHQDDDETLWARAESLDECYWLDVVLDGVRAMDYVASRPDSTGHVIVSGGSRGGWYALALAAVAPDRVALARFASPCYSDVTMNRQLGYGSAATEIYTTFERDRVKSDGRVFANFRYFDPLFLAELIRTPAVFSAGLQDNICSAIGMTATANRMPKEFCTFVLDPEGGHGGSPWMHAINQAAEDRVLRGREAP